MTPLVLVLVLLAAVTHALWNTWLKVSGDRLAALATLAAGWALVSLVSIPIVGALDSAAWPFLAVSVVVHTTYALTLVRAYGVGDLSMTYPIARGTGPLLVTVVSVGFLGDSLGALGILAVALIVIGVIWLGAPRSDQSHAGWMLGLVTGVLIGTYTLLDGLGARVGGSPHAFAAYMLFFTSVPIFVVAGVVHRARLVDLIRPIWPRGVIAGVLSAAAYWIIIWAMTVAPMGLVAAVRESSVVFVALLGSLLLKERVRWPAVVLVFGGIVLTRLA